MQNPQVKIIYTNTLECTQIKNHTAVLHNRNIYIFGGFDGKRNHNSLYIFNTDTKEWKHPEVKGEVPAGRNGHTATLVDNKMYVLGGWLGTGPFAASDMHSLNLDSLEWSVETTYGNSPGPCNMHSADLIGRDIYIFRGGDGRDYLNDLHSFNVDTKTWRYLDADGDCPPPRANHSSATYKSYLYIFGGWDGSKRLNDLFVLDTSNETCSLIQVNIKWVDRLAWSEMKVEGITPSPRAGMTLCTLQDKLYLFGGSGSSSRCFNDVHYFDTVNNTWGVATLNDDKMIKERAGHSMTAQGSYLYVIGGSFGQKYFRDYFILDTDPAPEIKSNGMNPKEQLCDSIREYCNNPEFSDITFMVEGKPFYGHKLILSLLSEKFRGMFNSGMKESQENQIVINHISYPVFAAICQYLYTGEIHFGAETEGQEFSLDYLLEFLTVSDEFLIEEIKLECQKYISNQVNDANAETILAYAERCNARQLKEYCEWILRKNSKL